MEEKQDYSYAYLLLGCVDFSTQSSTGNIHCLPINYHWIYVCKQGYNQGFISLSSEFSTYWNTCNRIWNSDEILKRTSTDAPI